jgi:hypothetical protein
MRSSKVVSITLPPEMALAVVYSKGAEESCNELQVQ